MTTLFTQSLANKLIQLLLLVGVPLLSRAQTVIVNYDFNSLTSGSTYPVFPATTAAGINSAATSTEQLAVVAGIATGSGAYAASPAGPALSMPNSSGNNTRYFQFELGGADLPKYTAFKIYLQGQRSGTGATNLTLQYSINGDSYVPFGSTYAPGNGVFMEGEFDLSGVANLNALNSLRFRLLASGASGSGTLRIDNLQVQAINTVDPLISSLAPATAEAGTLGFKLTVTGSNFKPGAVVSFNGQNLATDYKPTTSLVAVVPAAAIATDGSYPVTVTNPGGAASASTIFIVTPARVHWTGKGTTLGSWFDSGNWSTGSLPTPTDEVVLDHLYLPGRYTVSLDQNAAVSIKSLTVNPGTGDSVFIEVPAGNTALAALTLTNTGAGAVALAIYDKGVVTNASGASSGAGATGIDIADVGPTFFVYNGGSYRHSSGTKHATVVENLSVVPGTEQGIFDFRLPSTGSSSTSLSISERIYGTLVLRNRPGQVKTSFTGAAGKFLIIRGNLIIGSGVTFSPAINNDLQIAGDVRVQIQGRFQVKAASPPSPTSRLLLSGDKPQLLSDSIKLDRGIGLAISNSAGVTLAAPLVLNGPLTLTSGTLTTTATNLLTLSSTATTIGGSSTSYINGPLVRKTNAGTLTNFIFPIGSSTGYHPLTLDATVQDATTYLATQTEGPAPDNTNLPTSTTGLPQLTRVSRVRSYIITPTPAANSFSGTITLPFDPDDQINAPKDASFTIGKNSGSGWQNIGNSSVTMATPAPAGGYASGTITSDTFTSFGTFALASTNADAAVNPLPVTLIGFAARRQAADVRLSWTTASELRSARFDVQRSPDGQVFTTVATVAAQGTTGRAHQYAALDPAAPAGLLYYRLAQVDIDGRTAFSPVATLTAAGGLVLYPNPTRDLLTVPAPAGTLVQVRDLTGRVVQTVALPPSGEVSVSSLPAGTYWLRVNEDARPLRFSKE